MSNPLFAVRWAQDQLEDEWIRPAVACRWNQPEGDMALDDTAMREALLERLIGEVTLMAQRMLVVEQHMERSNLSLVHLTVQLDKLVEDVWRR